MPAVINCEATKVLAKLKRPPTECPACTSTDLTWGLAQVPIPGKPNDGRTMSNEVKPALVQGCEECSETLWIIDSNEELGLFTNLEVQD